MARRLERRWKRWKRWKRRKKAAGVRLLAVCLAGAWLGTPLLQAAEARTWAGGGDEKPFSKGACELFAAPFDGLPALSAEKAAGKPLPSQRGRLLRGFAFPVSPNPLKEYDAPAVSAAGPLAQSAAVQNNLPLKLRN